MTGERIGIQGLTAWVERNVVSMAPDSEKVFVAGNADTWRELAEYLRSHPEYVGTPTKE